MQKSRQKRMNGRKVLALLLCILQVLAMSACGASGTAATETEDPYAFLTEEEWVSAFDGDTTLTFASDGTGKRTSGNGTSDEITWEISDSSVSYTYTYNGLLGGTNTKTSSVDIVEYLDTYFLRSNTGIYVYASEAEDGYTKLKEYMSEEAVTLDWSSAKNEYLNNAARAMETYNGKIVRWTATCHRIDGSTYATFANETYQGLPLDAISVYLGTDDLIRLETMKTYSVVGIIEIGSFNHIWGAFLE